MNKNHSPLRWLVLLCVAVSVAGFAAVMPEFWRTIFRSEPSNVVAALEVVSKSGGKPLPIRETRAQSTNGSSLTILPISGSGPGERCTVTSYNAQGEPTLVAPSDDDVCKVQITWNLVVEDRHAGVGLFETRNWREFDRTVDDRGRQGNGLAFSGQTIAMLSPSGYRSPLGVTFFIRAPSAGHIVSTNVIVIDHPDAAMNFDIAADSCLALDGLGASYSDFLNSVDPGRWSGFIARNPGSPGANYDVVRRLPGTSYDFEFRTVFPGNQQQIRVTWYTYDGAFRPVWLQTEWLDLSTYDGLNRGSQFKGELRRYRWNPSVAGRTGGKRAGKISGVLLKPEYPAYGAGIRIMVNREWDEPGVTDALPGGKLTDGECLLRHNSFFEYGRNTEVNDAFSGVWSLYGDAPNSEADSVVISGGTETHLLRMWDTAGNPVWTFAMNSAPAPSVFVPSALTLPVRYARSPYTRGFPINLGPDHLYVPECKLNACEMCSIPVGTLMRSYNTPIDQYSNEEFNRAQLQINLSKAANQLAPDVYGSQCGTHNNQAPFGMGNPALNWVRPRTEDINNWDWVGAGRSRFDLDGDATSQVGRVRTSPQVVSKASYTSETSFRVSWAVQRLSSSSGGNYRLVRRRFGANDFKVVLPEIEAIGAFEDGIYQRPAQGVPEIRPFPPSSYVYEVRFVTPTDPVGTLVAKGTQAYVRDPRDPPLPPDCFKILEGTLTSTASANCPPGYGPNLNVQGGADLVLMFSNSTSAQYYHVSEEKLVNGELVPANCNTGYPDPLGASSSGEPQPPDYRLPIKACEVEGSYYYQVYACDHDFRCSRRAPITPIIVNVNNSVAAPQNVTAVRHVQPDDAGYGFKVNWEHPITTPPLGTTLDFQVRYRKPPSTSYTESTVIVDRQHVGIVATPRTPGSYEFSVRARTIRTVEGVQTTKFSEWSQSASLQLPPVQTSENLPAQLTPSMPVLPTATEIEQSSRVGSLDGSLRVNESGAVNFSIGFLTAPGKGGLVPEIGLAYGGDSQLGTAGVGFNLTGLSSIARCRKTPEAGDGPGPHPQINFDADNSNDAFCLDGQRLLAAGSGTQTIGATNYSFDEYRTEIESFQRVRAYRSPSNATGSQLVHGPLFWIVEGKDGSIREFGRDYADLATKSAVYANDGNLSGSDPVTGLRMPTRLLKYGRQHLMSWALSAHSDRLGNRIRYRYETNYNGTGEDPFTAHYLSRVFYTGYTGTAQAYEHAGLAFDYQLADISKAQRGWIAGSYSESRMQLNGVRSCLRSNAAVALSSDEISPTGTSLCDTQSTTLRVYEFNYQVQNDVSEMATQSPFQLIPGKYGSGRQRLTSLRECADVAKSICWSPTTLSWSVPRAGLDAYNASMRGAEFQRAAAIRFSDVTGDGKPDVIWREKRTDDNPDKLFFNRSISAVSGSGIEFAPKQQITEVSNALDNTQYGNDPDRNWGLLDVNGDGFDDLVSSESTQGNGPPWAWYVRLATGTDAGFSTTRTQLEGTSTFSSPILAQFQFTDTDGDGVVDMLAPRDIGARIVLQVAKGIRQTDGRLVFGAPVTVQLDFGTGPTDCYRVGFGRKHHADRWDSYDFNGDASADLALRVQGQCGEVDPTVVALGSDNYQFGLEPEPKLDANESEPNSESNPAANPIDWGVFVAQNLSTFNLSLRLRNVADVEGSFRPTDLNADGLLDLVWQENVAGKWYYQLNRGNDSFSPLSCLLVNKLYSPDMTTIQSSCHATRLPNNIGTAFVSDGQIVLQDFDGDGFVDVWHSEINPGGGSGAQERRFRVYRWKGAAGNSVFGACLSDPLSSECSDFEARVAVRASDNSLNLLTIPSGVWTNAIAGGQANWGHLMVDLDNDGYGDSLAYRHDVDAANADYVLIRNTDHHTPRDVLTSVTSGFGATTSFVYSPMSYASVYTRDFDGTTQHWGRGASVADLTAPSYVVTSMSTPAPLAGNANNLAWMHYRYQGMKAQAGGRGSLGFRKIYSLNAQNAVETATEYQQQFPLTGRPKSTESRALNATGLATWRLNCNPDAVPSANNACFYPQPRCTGGHCAHFSGPDANPATRGQVLARNLDTSAWRSRAPGATSFGAENATLPTNAHATIFAYTLESVGERYESASSLANIVIASSKSTFYSTPGVSGYDDYGNLKYSKVESYVGSTGGTLEQTVTSSSDYTNNPSTWQLGLLNGTSVTHARPGTTPITRTTQFAYDVNGQLRMERVQPGSMEFQFTKYTDRHRYGAPNKVYSCSKAVEDAGRCTSDFVLGNTNPGGIDARLWVYRYAQTDYDEVTGLATTTYALRGSGAGPSLVVAGTTSYTKWGTPALVTPTDGAYSQTTYDAFGRAVHQYSATGAQTTTLMARCDGVSVKCPAHAVTRVVSYAAGGPKQWAYADSLGRGVVALSELFKQGDYSVVYTEFDGLGRKIRQTEPALSTNGPAQANALPASSSQASTQSCYDVGGRVIYVKLPNHSGVFSCSSPPSVSTTPDNVNVSWTTYRGLITETVNGLGQQQRTTVNSLGETVLSEDSNQLQTQFAFDATGNLISVTRGAGTSLESTSSMLFDVMGRRTVIADPSTGTRRSYYNPAGESIREIDAKGQCLQSTLDFNGRVIQTAEYASSTGDNCTGTASKITRTIYDRDRLGAVASTSYGQGANSTEAGSVRMDLLYDPYSRLVSSKRCVVAVSVSRSDALNCLVDQQAYDQYGRPYWSSDASSENVLHSDNPYANAQGSYRGIRQHYSDESTMVEGVAVNAGFAFKSTNLTGTQVYLETLSTNARGQVTAERVDGKTQFTTTRGYEASTGRLLTINTDSVQNLTVTYDELGNLRSRTDQSAGRQLVENFSQYDVLNRVLTAELKNAGVSQGNLTMSYSDDGNVLSKQGDGVYSQAAIGGYSYGDTVALTQDCAAGSKHAVRAISDTGYCYDANGNQTRSLRRSDFAPQRVIAYSLFDKPSQIDSYEVGGVGHSTRYGYGPAREMAYRLDIPQYAGTVSNASVEVQYFGAVERELRKTGTAGQTRETYKRMIGGVLQIVEERVVNDSNASLASAAVVLRSEVLLKDHLGSTHVIVNSDGTNAQYQRFDVWGMRADASTGSTQSISQSYGTNNPTEATKTRTRKGFTGHEMVDGAGIVHMQGRIYDPRLGRFLQADPIIQDPLNGQNYNRYTYVYNNPLSLTDPSGYRSLSANLELYWKPVAAIAIVVVTGGQAYGALAAGGVGAKTAALMWAMGGGAAAGLVTTGTLRGTLMGAFDGALTFGIGQAYKGSFTALLIAHSLKGGMLEAFNGGEFGHGMLTAGLSKVTGLGVDALERGPVTSIILNAIAGGTVSKVTGGKFANGAVSAALQFAFNAALSSDTNPYQMPSNCPANSDATMSNGPPPLHKNSDLSVWDLGDVTFIFGDVKVGMVGFGNTDFRNRVVSESNAVFGNSVTEYDGRTYVTNITFTGVGRGKGDVMVGQMSMSKWETFRDMCRIASAWTPKGGNQILFAPKSLEVLHAVIAGNKTGAHEMGHFLGLTHIPRSTGGLMSYGFGPYRAAYGRTFTGQEASTLASMHRSESFP